MAPQCPHCQSPLSLKTPKPGRYTPKCPKCARAFLITFSANPEQPPVVAKLPENPAATIAPPTKPAPASSAATASKTAQTRPVTTPVDATAEFRAPADGAKTKPAPAASRSQPQAPTKAAPTKAGATNSVDATAEFTAGAQRPVVRGKNPTGGGASAPRPAPTIGAGDQTAPFTPAHEQGTSAATGAESQGTADFTVRPQVAPTEDQGITLPKRLGGYELVKELGRGGMGEVYLARQLSLDRNVAIKTMRPEWAGDPVFVARFTKEAFAAAQLVHHNFVQIYDINADRGTNFFSMEFVDGGSLAQALKQSGRLDAEVAAGYMLQAARGLALAHELGMVHRDIKPDNLMLSKHGIVKIADLGIVKSPGGPAISDAGPRAVRPAVASKSGETRGNDAATIAPPSGAGLNSTALSSMTQTGVGVGTPAYMAPEQARDAARVDGRADIYALGCTFYVLVTGRPPFEGRTSLELITKHATAPVVPPEQIVKRVPKALSDLILRMVAKKPEDRFQTVQEVITALERFLNVDSTGPFSPREEHAEQLETAVTAFRSAPMAGLRTQMILGYIGFCCLAALVCFVAVGFAWGGAFLGLAVLTPIAHFVLAGMLDGNFLFTKTRALIIGAKWTDWLTWFCSALMGTAVLYFLGLLFSWIAVLALAALIATGFYFGVDRRIAAARQASIEQIEQLIKRLRLLGLEEDSLRQFIAKYSGKHWEEFYETIFGYEAMLAARERWGKGENGALRPKFAAWRDPLVRSCDAKLQAREVARQHKRLIEVEQNGLRASGLSDAEARIKALEEANAALKKAHEVASAIDAGPRDKLASKATGKQTSARQSRYYNYLDEEQKVGRSRFGFLFSAKPRLLAAGALILGCLMWMNQNQMLSSQNMRELAAGVKNIDVKNIDIKNIDVNNLNADAMKKLADSANLPGATDTAAKGRQPLNVPLVPRFITGWFGNFFAGGAGLLLGTSALLSGRKAFAFFLAATLVFAAQLLF
jgi:serine/threonine protein kinase